MNNQELLKKIISHSKEYGFVYPSSEIYDGLSAVYDYGPYGSLLKNNIKEFWWKSMVQLNDNIVGLDHVQLNLESDDNPFCILAILLLVVKIKITIFLF